jgi:hypothetical protein
VTTESFLDAAKQLIESTYEYETSHADAGNNYAHLASEGHFEHHNGDNRLAEYCAEMGIDLTGIAIDRLAEEVIADSYMVQGQDYDPAKRFLVASYPVGEIETQVDSSDIGARLTPWLVKKLNRETDAYWSCPGKGSACFYITTDSYWDQVCNADVIQDLVNQQKES